VSLFHSGGYIDPPLHGCFGLALVGADRCIRPQFFLPPHPYPSPQRWEGSEVSGFLPSGALPHLEGVGGGFPQKNRQPLNRTAYMHVVYISIKEG